jgi:hypothetical protein
MILLPCFFQDRGFNPILAFATAATPGCGFNPILAFANGIRDRGNARTRFFPDPGIRRMRLLPDPECHSPRRYKAVTALPPYAARRGGTWARRRRQGGIVFSDIAYTMITHTQRSYALRPADRMAEKRLLCLT